MPCTLRHFFCSFSKLFARRLGVLIALSGLLNQIDACRLNCTTIRSFDYSNSSLSFQL